MLKTNCNYGLNCRWVHKFTLELTKGRPREPGGASVWSHRGEILTPRRALSRGISTKSELKIGYFLSRCAARLAASAAPRKSIFLKASLLQTNTSLMVAAKKSCLRRSSRLAVCAAACFYQPAHLRGENGHSGEMYPPLAASWP